MKIKNNVSALIGIYGENGAGKSTVARIINKLTGKEIKSFATPVKVMAAAYLNVPVETFENRDFKEKHRDLLIKIGDGIREEDPDFWINHLFNSYDDSAKDCGWVIDDVRKPNEIKAIRERGGIIIGVFRNPDRTCFDCQRGFNFEDMKDKSCPWCGSDRHAAVMYDISFIHQLVDFTINNSGTEQELEVKIKNILNEAQNS